MAEPNMSNRAEQILGYMREICKIFVYPTNCFDDPSYREVVKSYISTTLECASIDAEIKGKLEGLQIAINIKGK